MDKKALPEHIQRELDFASSISDDQIDLSDIPQTSFRGGDRGRFLPYSLMRSAYDVRSIANWFIDKAGQKKTSLSNMSLNKLVYFTYEQAILLLGRILTEARPQAWQHGPVFREIYHPNKGNASETVSKRIQKFDPKTRKLADCEDNFPLEVIELLEQIWNKFGSKSGSDLRNISHDVDGAWEHSRDQGNRGNATLEITPATILTSAPRRLRNGYNSAKN
ncbi:Panacea domain-containing protein [Sphingopyxis sp. C-1]|uniref:Panacea domain-containing protein n=1 Tax=Sphingopyxis sp. C-1 TaxID=262667 RepID=UPI0009FA4B57|nr:type II toxin-antitoxin system antitoxin SocA domain-containing protein [Sphingopyxis sp. C-1]